MTDQGIVARLRASAPRLQPNVKVWPDDWAALLLEAADEIERLRKLQEDIIATDYRIESWIKVRDERDALRSERDRYRAALEAIASHQTVGKGAVTTDIIMMAREALAKGDEEGS